MDIIEASIHGSLMACLVLVIRQKGRYLFPSGYLSILWCLVCLRFLLPQEIPGLIRIPVALDTVGESEAYMTPSVTMIGRGEQIGNGEEMVTLLFLLWIAGMFLCAAVFFAVWLYWKNVLHDSEVLSNERWTLFCEWSAGRKVILLRSNWTRTPFCCGLLQSKIVLPAGYPLTALELPLLHECMHIRHWDNLKKLLGVGTVCVHWFNPIAWTCYWMMSRDLELDCDKRVIQHLAAGQRGVYAHTLLSACSEREKSVSIYPQFGKPFLLKERIFVIMKWPGTTKWGRTIAVLATVTVAITLAIMFVTVERPLNIQRAPIPQGSGSAHIVQTRDILYDFMEEAPDFEEDEAFNWNRFNIHTEFGAIEEQKLANGDMAVFSDGGKPWMLQAGVQIKFELQVGTVNGYPNGQNVEMGVLHNGERNVLFDSKLKNYISYCYTIPQDGEYYFYVSNYSIDSLYIQNGCVKIYGGK